MEWLTPIIAVTVSVAVLWVQYRNQIERRHGEIVHLRTQLLAVVNNMRNQTVRLMMQVETMRLELRKVPDCDGKYDCIDLMPPLIKRHKDHKIVLDDFLARIEKWDTKKLNRSSVLLAFQAYVPELEASEKEGRKLDDDMLAILESVRGLIPPGPES